MRMYSTSRWTLVLVFVALMTCLEMYFMATSWPVMVWTASGRFKGERRKVAGSTGLLTLYFSKGSLPNFLDDSVLAELRWRVGLLLLRGDRHCEYGSGRDVGRRRSEERDYKQIAVSRGCK